MEYLVSAGGGQIVVGIDGSKSSLAALAWALDEARSRATTVRLVCAFGGVHTYGSMSMYGGLPTPDLANVRAAADGVLAEAAVFAAGHAPDVEVSTKAYDGDVVPMLLGESQQASSLILGSRRLGAFGSAVLGSVGSAVAARAECPVVVFRGPSALREERPAVVAGVDGLDTSDAVLGYAFDHASRRGLRLHAVLCWYPNPLAALPWDRDRPETTRAEAWLSEALAGWGERYPDVRTHASVTRDHPVSGLVAASHEQDLLVVATRGRHSLVGTLLGSVSQGVLHHATCPVAVVPMNFT